MKKNTSRTNSKSIQVQRSILEKKHHALEIENAVMKERIKGKSQIMQNSLSTLTAGLTQGNIFQDNITSFNPILQSNVYAPLTINWTLLMYAYKTHGLIQTLIDVPVLDAMRGGLDLISKEMDGDDLKDLNDAMDNDGDYQSIAQACAWSRLFGGSALIINVEDDPEKELDMDNLGERLELYAASRWELGSSERIPSSGKYQFYGQSVHESRVITMVGKRAPFIIENQLNGWGMSELERSLEDINLFLRVRNAIYELLREAKIDIYRLKGFTDQLVSPQGTQVTQQRIQAMNQLKGFLNALLLDSEDEYEQKQISFNGLAEMMKEARIGVASALRFPLTKLFGIGATGMNSGEEDIENYNAMVESEVRTPLRPIIRQVLRLKVRKIFGDDLDIDFKYKPLRVLSASDEETIATSKTARYLTLHTSRLIDSQEFGEMLMKEDLVPIAIDAEKGLLEDFPTPEEADAPAPTEDGKDGKEDPKKPDEPKKAKEPSKPKKSGSAKDPEEPETPAEGKREGVNQPGQPGRIIPKKK